MGEFTGDIADINQDVETLRSMIDESLENDGPGAYTVQLKALADVLYDRIKQLAAVEDTRPG